MHGFGHSTVTPARRSGEREARLEPVYFSVHDEGGGLLSLAMSPCRLADVGSLFVDPTFIAIDGYSGELFPLNLDGDGPVDVIDAPGELPQGQCLLGDPHHVLGEGRWAISVSEDDHAVFYGRDGAVLQQALALWWRARFGVEAPENLEEWLAPLDQDRWHTAVGAPGERFDVIDLQSHGVAGAVEAPTRWVGGHGHAWRRGWSW